MTQRELVLIPRAQEHSEPSKDAARHIESSAATLRAKVLDWLSMFPHGLTDEEIQFDLGMPGNTERPRRAELVSIGKVRDSGRTRETKSGRKATIWVAA